MEYIRSLFLLLGSSIFSLCMFEGGFRAYLFLQDRSSLEDQLKRSRVTAPPSESGNVSLGGLIEPSPWPELVYELKPNISVTFQGKNVRINRWSMRQSDLSIEKPPGTFRIIGLGDSIMFGWGVDEDKTYLRKLEKKIRESTGKNIEVLNFGCPGYNTSMEAAIFEKRALSFSPDLIIIHFVNNDLDVPAFMMEKEDPFDFKKSFLLDFVRERIGSIAESNKLMSVQSVAARKETKAKVLDQYRYMTGGKGFEAALRRIKKAANGVPILIFYGNANPAQTKMLRVNAKRQGYTLLPLKNFVDSYFKEHGLVNTPENRKRILTVAPNDRHPSELGHEIISEALLKEVIGLTKLLTNK